MNPVGSSSDVPKAIGSEEFVTNVSIDSYDEPLVSSIDYVKDLSKNPVKKVTRYAKSLLPIFGWIGHWPFTPAWIYGDFVAGVTVAIVLVPQSMSYAQIATLPSQYGLYSSFIGVMIYALFATSKDVSIGPVAVMSLEIGKIIQRVQARTGDLYDGPTIATMVALLCGSIALGIGLLRLGFLVELISLPAVLAFMSGSAFNIIVGQIPGLMGFNKHVNTRAASYKVVIDTLKNLHRTKVDAAFGLVSLFILYAWKFTTTYMYKRYPRQKVWFYIEQLRSAIVIIFTTLISYLVIRHHKEKHSFSVNGHVPSGLKNVGVMTVPPGLASELGKELPAAVIILVLEHISISKSFGRINDYKINPNQELIAIGVTNLVGTFFNAYPATGSFSRTALKSKCGVRTPFAGIFTGACVILSIYCFTDAFYYIPKAALSAIIIHAVSDLLASYKITWNLWRVQPVDFGIFIIGVIITVFASIEDGIYFAMCASAANVLWRLCKPNGAFLGRIKVLEALDPYVEEVTPASSLNSSSEVSRIRLNNFSDDIVAAPQYRTHYRWVPLPSTPLNKTSVHTDYVNNAVNVLPPPPGVVVFRPTEQFIYSNASRQVDIVLDEVRRVTKPANLNLEKTFNRPGKLEVSWFKKKGAEKEEEAEKDERPGLRLVHFDFSQVSAIDATSIQALIDLKKSLDLYSGPVYEIHFSGIINPWVKRGLANAGFGKNIHEEREGVTMEEFRSEDSSEEEVIEERKGRMIASANNIDHHIVSVGYNDGSAEKLYPLVSTKYPCFHLDIPSYTYLD